MMAEVQMARAVALLAAVWFTNDPGYEWDIDDDSECEVLEIADVFHAYIESGARPARLE